MNGQAVIQNFLAQQKNITFGYSELNFLSADSLEQSQIGYSVDRDFEDDFRTPQPEPEVESDPAPPAMIMQSAAPTAGLAVAQPGPVEAMRNAMIANFEQADLDVPAFLRKRTEPI